MKENKQKKEWELFKQQILEDLTFDIKGCVQSKEKQRQKEKDREDWIGIQAWLLIGVLIVVVGTFLMEGWGVG